MRITRWVILTPENRFPGGESDLKKWLLVLGIVVLVIGIGAVACGSFSDAGTMVVYGGAAVIFAGVILCGAGACLGSQPKVVPK